MPTLQINRLRVARRRGDDGGTIALRRRWFDGDGDTPEGDGNDDGEQDLSALPDWAQKLINDKEARLKEVNNESAGRRHQINELSERLKTLEEQRQQGLTLEQRLKETEQQMTGLRQFEDRAKSLEQLIRDSNQQRIDAIPETMRGLVPVDAMSPEQVATWLDKNVALLTKPFAPDLDGGVGGDGGKPKAKLSTEEKLVARAAGMSDEDYIKYKERAGL